MKKSLFEFGVLMALLSALYYILSEYIITDDMIYESLSKKLSSERIEEFLNMRQERSWYRYLFAPVQYLLKFLLISSFLYSGTFLFNKTISFPSLYRICIRAEFVFIIPLAIKVFWFMFIATNYNLDDLRSFTSLSAASLFLFDDLDLWVIYLLKSLSLFEVVYVLFLAYEMSCEDGMSFSESLKISGISYGLMWLLWLVFVLYFIVSFT